MDLTTWTPERAWWLGATLGDGNSDNAKGRRRLHFSSGDEDFVQKWAVLFSAVRGPGRERAPVYREDHNDWMCDGGCVQLTEWLATYNMDGRKGADLAWPQDLPQELFSHFVRGLFDSDGHVKRKGRTDGRRDLLAFEIFMKAEDLISGLLENVSLLHAESQKVYKGRYKGRVYPGACVRGKRAVEFARWLYLDAPEHLRCERKYQVARDYVAWWDAHRSSCERCGREVVDRKICKHCAQVKWTASHMCKECANAAKKVYAKGLCATCYSRLRRREKKSWQKDKAGLRQLHNFPLEAWAGWDSAKQEAELTKLLKLYRSKGFPWFAVRQDVDGIAVLSRVRRATVEVDGDEIRNVGWAGQPECLSAHHHRLKASYRGRASPVQFYDDDASLRRAIRYQLDHGDPVTPRRVLAGVKALTRSPTNFPPALARWIVDRYGVGDGTVLDPCAGYGGRLLGALASSRNVRYIGRDVEPRTVRANNILAGWCEEQERVEMRRQAVESPEMWPQVDLVMTCPPYFRRERYGTEADKALAGYWGNFERWCRGFLTDLVQKSLNAAPVVVICVAPVKHHSVLEDIPAKMAAITAATGGVVDKVWRWRLASFGSSARYESVMVLRRG